MDKRLTEAIKANNANLRFIGSGIRTRPAKNVKGEIEIQEFSLKMGVVTRRQTLKQYGF